MVLTISSWTLLFLKQNKAFLAFTSCIHRPIITIFHILYLYLQIIRPPTCSIISPETEKSLLQTGIYLLVFKGINLQNVLQHDLSHQNLHSSTHYSHFYLPHRQLDWALVMPSLPAIPGNRSSSLTDGGDKGNQPLAPCKEQAMDRYFLNIINSNLPERSEIHIILILRGKKRHTEACYYSF